MRSRFPGECGRVVVDDHIGEFIGRKHSAIPPTLPHEHIGQILRHLDRSLGMGEVEVGTKLVRILLRVPLSGKDRITTTCEKETLRLNAIVTGFQKSAPPKVQMISISQ